jgi:hypothetical protein
MCRRIWSPRQTERRGGIAQLIADHSGLHASKAFFGIDFENVVKVPAPIHHDRRVTALPAQARPASPRKDWCSKISANGNRRHNILNRSWNHHANRHLTVIRTIHRIKRAISGLKTDRSAHLSL